MLTLARELRDLGSQIAIASGSRRHKQASDNVCDEDGRETDSHASPVAKKGLHVLRGAVIRGPNEQARMPSLYHEMGTSESTVESRSTRVEEGTEAGSAASSKGWPCRAYAVLATAREAEEESRIRATAQ